MSAACERVDRERASRSGDHHERGAERAGGRGNQTELTRYEACWSARADFGVASLELREYTVGFGAVNIAMMMLHRPSESGPGGD